MPEPPLLEVRGVSRTYTRARTSLLRRPPQVHALRDVSLSVHRGQRFGIVGESGSGKSTLLRLLCALDHPTSGTVVFDGQVVSGQPERALRGLRRRVQIVFQDPMGSLDPRMRVLQIIAEPLVVQRHEDPAGRVRELLAAVGLPADAAQRFPHQFSGGQRQRIAIARALATQPSVLVADEPVSALDVSVRAQILNLLDELVEQYDLTLVFVSHDLSVVRYLCDTICVLHDGQVVETGSTQQVHDDPQHPYTRRLVAAVPSLRRALAGVSATQLAHEVLAADPEASEELR